MKKFLWHLTACTMCFAWGIHLAYELNITAPAIVPIVGVVSMIVWMFIFTSTTYGYSRQVECELIDVAIRYNKDEMKRQWYSTDYRRAKFKRC